MPINNSYFANIITTVKTQHIYLIFLAMLLWQSCAKDNCLFKPGNNYTYLAEESINQTPYFNNKAFDTISFASDKGDTLTFIKTKTETTWYEEMGSGTPDCGYDKENYQTLRNTYQTIKGAGTFEVKHSKRRQYTSPETNLLEVNFNGFNFLINDYSISSKIGGKFYDSLVTTNKTYRNVNYIFHDRNDSVKGVAYINKEYGFFLINDNQSKIKYNYIVK